MGSEAKIELTGTGLVGSLLLLLSDSAGITTTADILVILFGHVSAIGSGQQRYVHFQLYNLTLWFKIHLFHTF